MKHENKKKRTAVMEADKRANQLSFVQADYYRGKSHKII